LLDIKNENDSSSNSLPSDSRLIKSSKKRYNMKALLTSPNATLDPIEESLDEHF